MSRRLYTIKNVGSYLANRDGGWKCHYCNCEIHPDPTMVNSLWKPKQATVDHMIPLGKGGANNVQNMVLACSVCNDEKSDMDYFAFWRIIYTREGVAR